MSSVRLDDLLDNWLGKNNYQVWCVSLTRATNRRTNFSNWANHVGLTFKFWDATDCEQCSPVDLQRYGCDVHINRKQCVGASCCRISITRCLEYHIHCTNNDYVFIFEDDAGFHTQGKESGCSSTELSCKETLLEFVQQCTTFLKENGGNPWDQVWFGYYDEDVERSSVVDARYPLVHACFGTCLTHAMLLKRETVKELLDLLSVQENRTEPIDSFTRYIMVKNGRTIIPPKTIICQTGNDRFINYPS